MSVGVWIDSLPDGAPITGEAAVPAALTREALTAEISFVVSVQTRREIRRVFPPPRVNPTAPSFQP